MCAVEKVVCGMWVCFAEGTERGGVESLLLPTINKYLLPAQYQHGFRREHSTTSALLQLTTDIAMRFNQRKPLDRTVCVAVDLSAALDTVCHKNLLSNINISQLHPATARLFSCYLRGRQDLFQRLGKYTPASHKAPSCHHRCSAFTLLTCRDQQIQLMGSATLMT